MGATKDSKQKRDYELGELDIDLSPAPRAAQPPASPGPAAPARPAPQRPNSSRGGAEDLDLGGFGGGGDDGPLELATSSNDNWRGSVDHLVGGPEDDDPLNAPQAMPMPELDAVPRRPNRLSGTRTQREAEAFEHDPRRRARELAGFGSTPSGLLGCVPYVVKVATRRQQLAGERKKLVKEQKALKERLDEALLELGRALSTQPAERLSRVKPQHDAVLMARGAAEAADQNAAELRRQAETKIRELDAQILQLKTALEPFERAEAEARLRFDRAENERKRATALLARVDIERRAIETAEGQVDEAREQALAKTKAEREQTLAQAQAATDEAREGHERAQMELNGKQREVDALVHDRRKLAEQAEKEQRKLESAAAGAEGELTQRLRDLGRAATEAGFDELGGDRARRVRDLDKQFGQALEQKQIYELAQGAYDGGAVARGVGLVATLAAGAAAAVYFL